MIRGDIVISNRPRKDLVAELKAKNFAAFATKPSKAEQQEDASEGDETESASASASDYDYLLRMPLWSLTLEKVQKLMQERDDKEKELNLVLSRSPQEHWKLDLESFLVGLDQWEVRPIVQLASCNRGAGRRNSQGADGQEDHDEVQAQERTGTRQAGGQEGCQVHRQRRRRRFVLMLAETTA